MLSDVQSSNVSAQSPPWSRNASPRCASASSLFEVLDLPRRHERRQSAQRGHRRVERGAVAVNGLLRGRPGLPARGIPVGWDARLRHTSRLARSTVRALYTRACRQACSSRFARYGPRDVPSCCANSETRSSSISHRYSTTAAGHGQPSGHSARQRSSGPSPRGSAQRGPRPVAGRACPNARAPHADSAADACAIRGGVELSVRGPTSCSELDHDLLAERGLSALALRRFHVAAQLARERRDLAQQRAQRVGLRDELRAPRVERCIERGARADRGTAA